MKTATLPNPGFLRPRVTAKMHPKVTSPDLLAFFQQLSTLFGAGTPIYEALIIAAAQTQSQRLSDVIHDIADQVASGTSLHAALARHERYFRAEWNEVIRSGEESGQLAEVLQRLTRQIDAAAQLRSKLVSAMMYPAIIMVVAVGAVVVMLVKVVPTFASMFESFGKELPGITQAVLNLSAFMQDHVLMLLGGITVGVIGMRRYLNTPEGAQRRDNVLIAIPGIGDVIVQVCMQKFANNMSMLLGAGLPLLESLHSLKGIFKGNAVYHAAMSKVAKHVERGGQLAEAVEQTGAFTNFASSMTRIGEESGTLAEVLSEVEIYYRRKVETVVERLASTLETVVILVMGVTVAVILCAVYLPMFSMASGVG
ncbi:MAG: type II secretion system protein F [Planctomycetota bacterium]|nr:MAG: type II secretion system protein F [Planctomycetota bacterium]